MSLLQHVAIFLLAAVIAVRLFRCLGSVLGYLARQSKPLRASRAHDEATLARQHAIHEDEKKLLQSALESARQLESLFEADAAEAGKLAPRPGP
jgi:hypothetical protein